jgi:hypothetical protein
VAAILFQDNTGIKVFLTMVLLVWVAVDIAKLQRTHNPKHKKQRQECQKQEKLHLILGVMVVETPVVQHPMVVEGRVQCDSCSARAAFVVSLPFGDLAFCKHHYNKNAVTLTERGGIARLLDSLSEDLGEL